MEVDLAASGDGATWRQAYAGPVRVHSFAYGAGQRLCFAEGELWREAVVLRPPSPSQPTHLVRVHVGAEAAEEEVDLDAQPHTRPRSPARDGIESTDDAGHCGPVQ